MTIFEIKKELSQLNREQLTELNGWLCAEIKSKRTVDNILAIGKFSVGDRVRINGTVKPKKFRGVFGRVISIHSTKLSIEPEAWQGGGKGPIMVPAASLIAVGNS